MHEPSSMLKVYASPTRYYQGPGVLREISGRILQNFGGRLLVFGGSRALRVLMDHGFHKSMHDQAYRLEEFRGECCDAEVERLSKIGLDSSCRVVVGAGGGKAWILPKLWDPGLVCR